MFDSLRKCSHLNEGKQNSRISVVGLHEAGLHRQKQFHKCLFGACGHSSHTHISGPTWGPIHDPTSDPLESWEAVFVTYLQATVLSHVCWPPQLGRHLETLRGER